MPDTNCLTNIELFGEPKNGIFYEFDECYSIISAEIEKRRKRWLLNRIVWMNYDDVAQIIKIHIYKKWYLWDQKQPLLLWLNRVISNQTRNLIRNVFSNFSSPCTQCPLNLGGGICREYGNTYSSDCETYNIWRSGKKFNKEMIQFPNSIHDLEDNAQEKLICQSSINPIHDFDRFHELLLERLTPLQKQIYTWLYIEGKNEEEVSKLMKYEKMPKSSSSRVAGYRQITKFKAIFVKHAKKIIETNDF